MDLIDRKAAVSAISDLILIKLNCARMPTWNEVYHAIGDISAIPAVPLEPLCEWLAGYADPPKYAMVIIPKSGECLINARAKAWEHHFKNMMECGLMDEGGKE